MHDRLLGADPAETPLPALTDRAVRALTLVLLESEWQVLRRVEPDPLGWLRTQVRRRLDQTDASATTSESDEPQRPERPPARERFFRFCC